MGSTAVQVRRAGLAWGHVVRASQEKAFAHGCSLLSHELCLLEVSNATPLTTQLLALYPTKMGVALAASGAQLTHHVLFAPSGPHLSPGHVVEALSQACDLVTFGERKKAAFT